MASVFSGPGFMVVLYWLTYVKNSKKLNRKNIDGIGIILMEEKLKEAMNLPDFPSGIGSPSF